jgi:RNA polymerase sigma-70 factor (ECF subfamily)
MYDHMEAEDVLQNSFIDVFTKIRSFRGESTIGAWIKRIVINNCINQIKKKKIETNTWDDRYSEIPEESEEKYRIEDVELIKGAIKQLPDGYRAVFSLYAIEGYDHQEIGQILGVTEATSKSQYSRAKKKIRHIIRADSN